jgi:hypothetical protein
VARRCKRMKVRNNYGREIFTALLPFSFPLVRTT